MKTKLFQLGVIFVVMSASMAARADGDEQAACDSAFSSSDGSLRDRKLVEAREQLRTCSRTICGSMAADCSKQLAAMESRVPAIILRAELGGQSIDASVMMDQKPLVTQLDGRSVDVNPGPHVFTFALASGRKKEVRYTVVESEKGQKVSAVFEAEAAKPRVETVEPPPDTETKRFPYRTVGYATGAAGVVGVGIGAVFGLVASGKKSDAHCDSTNLCDDGSALDSARSAATVSTVGFIAGGVLLAAGIGIVLFSPSSHSGSAPSTGALRIVPSLGAGNGGAAFGGSF